MEHHYGKDVLLKLKKAIYGLKQAAMAFWHKLLEVMLAMGNKRSRADPCVYYRWNDDKTLTMWLSWIDDNICAGPEKHVKEQTLELSKRFEVDDIGVPEEYVGCKIERNMEECWIKMTQPVLVQKASDEFDLPARKPNTPAFPGSVLVKSDKQFTLDSAKQTKYRSGCGLAMHIMRYTRPEIYNAVRDCTRHMAEANKSHFEAMTRVLGYIAGTPKRGLLLKPFGTWNGTREYKFKVNGRADSDYAKNPDDRKSVSGCRTLLNGAPVIWRSSTQPTVSLSVTESEQRAGVQCAQDMLYVMRWLEALELQVEKPMVLEMDNKGAIDLLTIGVQEGKLGMLKLGSTFYENLRNKG